MGCFQSCFNKSTPEERMPLTNDINFLKQRLRIAEGEIDVLKKKLAAAQAQLDHVDAEVRNPSNLIPAAARQRFWPRNSLQ